MYGQPDIRETVQPNQPILASKSAMAIVAPSCFNLLEGLCTLATDFANV
jgi:hypothetical protein